MYSPCCLKSNNSEAFEKLILAEYQRRKFLFRQNSKNKHKEYYDSYAQAARAYRSHLEKSENLIEASRLSIELDRFYHVNCNLDPGILRGIIAEEKTIGAIEQPVSEINSFAAGSGVWRILFALPKGVKIRVHLQHAAAGKEGAFHLITWADKDHDGVPDTQIAVSPLLTAEKKGQWSQWEFTPTNRTVFVGLATKTKISLYYQMNRKLEGYHGLSNRLFFSRGFNEKPQNSVHPRYSNLRVEILRQ